VCRRTRLENVFTITIRAFDPGFRAHAQINHRMAHGGVAASIAADGGIIGFNCFRRFIDYGVIHFLNKSFLAARTNRGTGFVVREAGVPNMFRTIFQTSVGDNSAALKMLHADDTRCSPTINRRAMAKHRSVSILRHGHCLIWLSRPAVWARPMAGVKWRRPCAVFTWIFPGARLSACWVRRALATPS